MKKIAAPLAFAAVAAAAALPAQAGRPLNTEDATTLGDWSCQLESWVDRYRGNTSDYFFVPACAAFGVEAQFGWQNTRAEHTSRTAGQFFQLKHAFKSIDDGDWGVGFVAGISRDRLREEKTGWGDPYFIVPVSFGIGADKDTRWVVHLNLGGTRARDEGRNVTLWGVAFEKPITERFAAVGEVFGENSRNPWMRLGGVYTVIDEHLSVDLTYVKRSGGQKEENYWSLGFHLETAPLLK